MDITKIAAIGIANQRETTLAWDSASGETLYNAISKIACKIFIQLT